MGQGTNVLDDATGTTVREDVISSMRKLGWASGGTLRGGVIGQGDLYGGGWNEFREPACGGMCRVRDVEGPHDHHEQEHDGHGHG